jgi:hypothetical protein
MTTTRSLSDDITNALDFMVEHGLALYTQRVSCADSRVGWYSSLPAPFLVGGEDTTVDQYLGWVTSGHYSALLNDGGLLQLTYRMDGRQVAAHRLAYVPCPVDVDESLLQAGEPVGDVVELYLDDQARGEACLRSPIRFDFAPDDADEGHPAAHLTVNRASCRIACVAPLHPYRFIDFVFRHFYPTLHAAEVGWFDEASSRHIGSRVISEDDIQRPHIMWMQHAPVA